MPLEAPKTGASPELGTRAFRVRLFYDETRNCIVALSSVALRGNLLEQGHELGIEDFFSGRTWTIRQLSRAFSLQKVLVPLFSGPENEEEERDFGGAFHVYLLGRQGAYQLIYRTMLLQGNRYYSASDVARTDRVYLRRTQVLGAMQDAERRLDGSASDQMRWEVYVHPVFDLAAIHARSVAYGQIPGGTGQPEWSHQTPFGMARDSVLVAVSTMLTAMYGKADTREQETAAGGSFLSFAIVQAQASCDLAALRGLGPNPALLYASGHSMATLLTAVASTPGAVRPDLVPATVLTYLEDSLQWVALPENLVLAGTTEPAPVNAYLYGLEPLENVYQEIRDAIDVSLLRGPGARPNRARVLSDLYFLDVPVPMEGTNRGWSPVGTCSYTVSLGCSRISLRGACALHTRTRERPRPGTPRRTDELEQLGKRRHQFGPGTERTAGRPSTPQHDV
jgi:hypothetical protein